DLAGPLEAGAGGVNVQPHGVNLAAGGLGQAVAGHSARVGFLARNAKHPFGYHPGVAREFGQTTDSFLRIRLAHDLRRRVILPARRRGGTVKFKMSELHTSPDRYDPVSFPEPAPSGEPRRPTANSRWVQRAVIAVTLALVLIPALWGFVPGEIARWHDAAAKE